MIPIGTIGKPTVCPGTTTPSPGAYYVTICTRNRACLFEDVVAGAMRLNDAGRIVNDIWVALPTHYPGIALDAFVVMPNHVHGIIILLPTPIDVVGARFIAPVGNTPPMIMYPDIAWDVHSAVIALPETGSAKIRPGAMNRAPTRTMSLGVVVRGVKARVTAALNRSHGKLGVSIWQRNYDERIVRNESELQRIRRYIDDNPRRWSV
jgi:REP element-mobilizing transposase RayT